MADMVEYTDWYQEETKDSIRRQRKRRPDQAVTLDGSDNATISPKRPRPDRKRVSFA